MASFLIGQRTARAFSAGVTSYLPVGGGGFSSTETDEQQTIRQAIIVQLLWVKISANTLDTGTSTVRLRKNAGDGNNVVSIGAGATGQFEDLSSDDSVAAGDEINLRIIASGSSGSISFQSASVRAVPSTYHGLLYTTVVAGTAVGASLTRYFNLAGAIGVSATEADAQLKTRIAGTLRNFQVKSLSNSRSDSTTFNFRKNGSNGNQTISVGAGSTGIFEDTSNTDSVSDGDLICGAFTTGGGTGTIAASGALMDQDNNTDEFEIVCSAPGGVAFAIDLTTYMPPQGLISSILTESNTVLELNLDRKSVV